MKTPFFILGTGRCGSTFLYRLLKEHPAVALTNESGVVDFLWLMHERAKVPAGDSIERWLDRPMELHGAVDARYTEPFVTVLTEHLESILLGFYTRLFPDRAFTHWGDKLPDARAAAALATLLPAIRFVIAVRDPRDYTCSMRSYRKRPYVRERYPRLDGVTAEGFALGWRNLYAGALRYLDHTTVVRYEDLVADPRAVVARVLEDLGLPPAAEVSRAIEDNDTFHGHGTSRSPEESVERWRRELSADDVAVIERTCGDLLRRFGYAPA